VRLAVTKLAAFLDKYILSGEYKTSNTFFSGSGKGADVSCPPFDSVSYNNISVYLVRHK